MIALRDFLRGTSETASRKILLEVFSRDAELCEGEEEGATEEKADRGCGWVRATVRDTRGQKVSFEIFPLAFSSPTAAAVLFILSTVHLTLKCADDSPLFPPHFALALLLRAFPLSRLFGNLFFYPRDRGDFAALFVTVNHRYPFPSTFFLVRHNRILMLVLILA